MTQRALRLTLPIALLVSSITPGLAADVVWAIQSFQHADGLVSRSLDNFAERLRAQSAGRIDIEVLPAGQVVPNDETPRAINAGLLQGHYNTPSYFARLDPAFAILGDTLSAYPDPVARDRWFYQGGGLELVRDLYAKNGLYFIGPVYWPPDWMPATLPLRSVGDLDGVRIRSPGGLVGDLLRKAGSNVVQLPTGQIQDALEAGQIDATDWAHIAVNQSSGLYDVTPYNILMRHSMVLTEISVGLEDWASLPDDLKPIVEDAVRDFSSEMRRTFDQQEENAAHALEVAGVTSITWDKAEAGKLRELLLQVWQDWRLKSAFATALIDSHKAYMQKAGIK